MLFVYIILNGGIEISKNKSLILIQMSIIILLLIFVVIFPQIKPVYSTSSIDYNSDKFIDYRNDWSIDKDDLKSNSQLFMTYSEENIFQESEKKTYMTSNKRLSNSSWPMAYHDLHHTCQSPHSTENNPGTEIWRFRTHSVDGTIEASIALDMDGNIYFGSMGTDRKAYCLYSNGTKKWHYQLDGSVWSTPAVDEDGIAYFTSWDAGLYAIYPNGTRKWRFGAGDPITSSPAIADDGTTYFGCYNKKLFAVDSNGTKKWEFYGGGEILSDPAIGNDGTIYFGSSNEKLYAVNPNGTLKWHFTTGADIKGHPSIGPDGTIYCPSFDGYLYALYSNGTLKWQADTGSEVAAAVAAIGKDGTIYVGTELLRAFYPNGTLKWSYDIDGYLWGTGPAISDDGTIYVANDDKRSLIAINTDGTLKWKIDEFCNYNARSSPIISEDGTIYVGSSWYDGEGFWFGNLHAFGEGELDVVAGGPYEVYAGHELQFNADIFGGIPPYEFHWDFDDGNTSDLEDPIHVYYELGKYNATFTVIDSEDNVSIDYAEVTVTSGPPIVNISKPKNDCFYLFNFLIKDDFLTNLVIGRIEIEVEASQMIYGIDYVEFYINDELIFTDYSEPYEYTWRKGEFLTFDYDIDVVAYDNSGNYSSDWIGVFRIL